MGSSAWHGGHHQSGLVTSVDDGKARDATSGAQFAALPLVKPVV